MVTVLNMYALYNLVVTSHSITAQHSIRFHHHPLMLFLDSFEAIGSDDIVEFEKWGPDFQQSYTDGDCFD